MSGTLLGDVDLVATILRLKEFRPFAGASGRILISGEPGLGARVKYVVAATEEIGLVFEVNEPSSDETLDLLYRESRRIVDAAWDEPAATSAGPARPALEALILGMPGAGFDS